MNEISDGISNNLDSRAAERFKRVCLFGGTFDPVHLGHTHIAASAVRLLKLDLVVFLPCRQSPHKKGQDHAGEHHRLKMCQLATSEYDWSRVDDFDLTAAEPCYSWRTAEAMRKKYSNAKLYWLMGTDQWDALPRWNRPDHLASLVDFIVFERGYKAKPRANFNMTSISGDHPASATAIRQGLPTGLRQDWLNPSVLEYIKENRLYSHGNELA
ncbi:MAG: nicotinate (nicotinamide) nucleotide adenylyltransferase [Akkermansiaceae bacterium]